MLVSVPFIHPIPSHPRLHPSHVHCHPWFQIEEHRSKYLKERKEKKQGRAQHTKTGITTLAARTKEETKRKERCFDQRTIELFATESRPTAREPKGIQQ